MNILFLTMSIMRDVTQNGIYTDLMRKFRDEGHKVYVVTPCERREGLRTALFESAGVQILRVKTLNVQKTNVIEKGLGQVSLEYLYQKAINRYYKDIKFDLIIYSTPPITFPNVISNLKKQNPDAIFYLMLKDIFPQNAVDLGMLSKGGVKGILYKSFRKKEKRIYQLSDWIGCMSPANVQYVLKHNSEVSPSIVEICPNSYEVQEDNHDNNTIKKSIRQEHKLPINKPIFIYGGNMGKPQGIPFLLECLKANMDRNDCHFVIVGNGTEYPKIEAWVNSEHPTNVTLYQRLPKVDYDKLANACDVGLIFLDYRFTIPNYPSRLLPYLMGKKPILAATDPNCDTGSLAEANGYGMWCPSNDVNAFTEVLNKMLKSDLKAMGEKGYEFYLNNYTVQHTYDAIMKHFSK